jgi:3-oxoacyl-[acyl-carrier protein] reductase
MADLAGKTAVVTGASRGIGEATARHLAKQGTTVVLGARSEDRIRSIAREIVTEGNSAHAVTCDVKRAGDVRALIEAAIDETGRIDMLVNNAGVIDPIARLADSDPDAWNTVVDVNIKGVYHGLRFAIPEMIARGGGTIINMSSGAATTARIGWSHYCATKAAVQSLTQVADKEYRDQGIRVIGLSPGPVATDMHTHIEAAGIDQTSQPDRSSHIPPEWVARAIAWLSGPQADSYCGLDFSLKTKEGRAAVGLGALA